MFPRQLRAISTICTLALAAFLSGCQTGAAATPVALPLSTADDALAVALLREAEVDPKTVESKARSALLALARQTRCPCPGRRASLVDCAARSRCIRGPFAVRAILRGVKRKEPEGVISARLVERFGPREPESIDVSLAPCRGPQAAPVTMVVFSDFQCPYCALARVLLERLEAKSGQRLRTCFFNLVVHKEARLAAQAAAAAHLQGKFWPFHDELFTHRKAQERDDLLGYARALGLDLARFESDMDGVGKVRVLRDELIANKLRLDSTPSFFINGRPMTDRKTLDDFLDWIAEAVALKNVAAKKNAASKPAAKKNVVESKPAAHEKSGSKM